jgi:hypothetical protein
MNARKDGRDQIQIVPLIVRERKVRRNGNNKI